ncbi:MAG: hypothetical protein CMJ18_07180 [Phycisphaeraceae bacterium]|nr:hypothetical protein [Phycisphaeraceae bacterium]
MRIGIFTNVLVHPPTGIGWHVIHLLTHLSRIDRENEYLLFYRSGGRDGGETPFCPDADNFTNVPVRAPDLFFRRFFRVFDRLLLPQAIERRRIDVFHGPNHYLPARRRAPQIVTYHDLAAARMDLAETDRATERQSLLRTLGRADRVISVTECTARDLRDEQVPLDRIDVIHQGANFDGVEPPGDALVAATRRRFRIEGPPHILFVGSLVPRKNLGYLLHAYARLRSMTEACPTLVLAGADDAPEADRLREQAGALGIADGVVMTGYLTSDEVRGLYGGAAMLVLPSRYEGFGMTVLEAMAYEVPVIATRAGSLEEVVGDAGILVGLDDESALAGAMARLLAEPQTAADLVRRGLERIGRFSWERCARRTLEVYRETVDIAAAGKGGAAA